MGRLFFGATALRIDATASADSFIEFQVDPFGLDSGYVAIRQRVKTQSCCGTDAYATARGARHLRLSSWSVNSKETSNLAFRERG